MLSKFLIKRTTLCLSDGYSVSATVAKFQESACVLIKCRIFLIKSNNAQAAAARLKTRQTATGGQQS